MIILQFPFSILHLFAYFCPLNFIPTLVFSALDGPFFPR